MDIQQITPHADGIAIPLSVLPTTLLCSSPLADSKVKLESLSNPAVVKNRVIERETRTRQQGGKTSLHVKDVMTSNSVPTLSSCPNCVT